MENLIEALQIFLKYDNPDYPTHCEHDILYINIDPIIVSKEDKNKLDKLGFMPGNDEVISLDHVEKEKQKCQCIILLMVKI